ncbi:hypothetical protein NHJ13051_005210 [Beauveria bassiana]
MKLRTSQLLRSRCAKGSAVRVRVGARTHIACVGCKDSKVICDGQAPACGNCQRLPQRRLISLKPEADLTYGLRRSRPLDETASARDYLDRLEQRVNLLEEQLREAKSGQVPVPGRESDASWDADFDQSEGDDLASIEVISQSGTALVR